MENWQLCPKCKGEDYCGGYCCSLCKGAKVISAYTGKPPIQTITLSNTGLINGELTKIH